MEHSPLLIFPEGSLSDEYNDAFEYVSIIIYIWQTQYNIFKNQTRLTCNVKFDIKSID